MATFSGDPWNRKITWKYLTGQQTEQIDNFPTSWFYAKLKDAVELPKFVPGQFNIKPYYVASESIEGKRGRAISFWTEVGGTKVTEELTYTGHLPSSQLHYVKKSHPVNTLKATEAALIGAFAKLNEAQWDAAVDLAEIGGTFDLIKDGLKLLASPAKGIPRLIRQLKMAPKGQSKGDKRRELTLKQIKRDGEKGSKAMADAWLTYRYGIMPLILSIQDALELLRGQLQSAGNQIRTVRRRPTPETVEGHVGEVLPSRLLNQQWKVEIRHEAIVYYKRTADETLQEALGMLPTAIPNILWETTRLSFVWDWFFSIGDFLAALKPKIGVQVLGATTSTKLNFSSTIFYTHRFSNKLGGMARLGPWHVNNTSFKRTVRPGSSYTPVFTGVDEMTLPRWADAVALALKPVLRTIGPQGRKGKR